MNSTERRLKIYDILVEKETIDVGELSQHFGVSPMTIRRDLAIFEKQGVLTTTYGGAYLNQTAPDNIGGAVSQLDDNTRRIGMSAMRLVKNGDHIFIDSGAMTAGIAYGIRNLRVTVITNSLTAANILRAYPKIELIMAPGGYNDDLGGFVSSATISFIRHYNFDLSILNGDHLDTGYGLTAENETDAHLKATAIDSSKKTAVMIKSDDIGEAAFAQVVALRRIDYVVTDRGISADDQAAIEQRGPQVFLTD
ncbi:MAG: DeoR/GlpR family DNA-binding transcription regulator [Christensenella sp.]|nr:DeoR/GlpR family DNA-binding transcription regulator [Christensenella sp.]